MKRYLIALLFCFCLSVQASTPDALFHDANAAYGRNDFKKAAQLYEQLLSDHKSAAVEVYYNLGNAYYKQNDYTNAALNYERALKLNPAGNDIRNNRDIVNQRIEDQIIPVPELFYMQWFNSLRDELSVDAWAFIVFLMLSLCTISWFLYVLSKKIKVRKAGFVNGIIFFILAAFSFLLGYSSYNNTVEKNSAIVFVPTIQVKGSPADSGSDLFIIHTGTRVEITDQLNDWVKIRLLNGNEGWVRMKELEII